MSFWEKNLEVLQKVAPDLAATLAATAVPEDHQARPSRSGPPYLQVGKQRLTSSYDPVKEGHDWAQALGEADGPLVVFGLGLGYHVLPLLAQERPLWVVEPSAAVARLALEHQDLTALLDKNGLRLGSDFTGLPKDARLVDHTPTRRLHPGPHRRLLRFLAGEEGELGALRILVVGPLYGGSHPIARYTTRGFKELGHVTEFLDFAPFYAGYQALARVTKDQRAEHKLKQELLRLLGETILTRVRDFKPDLVFALAQSPVAPPLLKALKAEVPLVAYWFVEDFQVLTYWQELAPEVDVFFTLQKEPFFSELKRRGVKNYACLPLAADLEAYHPVDLTPEEKRRFGAAVSFVGAGYYNRRQFFQGLTDFDFKIWGSEWVLNSPLAPCIQNQAARVSEEDSVKVFNTSRINLNLHSSPFHAGINPQGDYLNPRVFDLAACGAFQLVDWRAQLPEFFTPDKELATFTSLAEAREKISYYLAHEDDRRRLAAAGRERVLREHTYARRLATALEIIQDLHPGALPHRRPQESAAAPVQACFPADHPVQALLDRLPEGTPPDLEGLVSRIKESDEPLTEPEAILWFLHEFRRGLQGRGANGGS
ncbi:MAG: glycosyltransferase [Deltaproteobacteria bacterium]|nr:glycosyltransferase [Deltaproteobacteria bacterium]